MQIELERSLNERKLLRAPPPPPSSSVKNEHSQQFIRDIQFSTVVRVHIILVLLINCTFLSSLERASYMNGGRRARISSLILLHILFISQIFYESNQTVYILLEHNCDNLECVLRLVLRLIFLQVLRNCVPLCSSLSITQEKPQAFCEIN